MVLIGFLGQLPDLLCGAQRSSAVIPTMVRFGEVIPATKLRIGRCPRGCTRDAWGCHLFMKLTSKYKSYLARVGDVGKLDLSMSEVAMDLVHV